MSTIRILLVCREGIACQKYLDACTGQDAMIDVASSFEDLNKAIVRIPYNGILIDMPTKLVTLSKDKERVDTILELYPVARLTFNDKSRQLCVFYYNETTGSRTLDDFLAQQCRSFTARTIRSDRRKAVVFNVILSKCKDVNHEDDEKTVIMNISKGGCFIFSNHKWEADSDAWFIIKELTDQTPIRGEVKWKVDWGQKMSVPGIGIQFMDISDSQFKEICAISRL